MTQPMRAIDISESRLAQMRADDQRYNPCQTCGEPPDHWAHQPCRRKAGCLEPREHHDFIRADHAGKWDHDGSAQARFDRRYLLAMVDLLRSKRPA